MLTQHIVKQDVLRASVKERTAQHKTKQQWLKMQFQVGVFRSAVDNGPELSFEKPLQSTFHENLSSLGE